MAPLLRALPLLDLRRRALPICGDGHLDQVGEALAIPGNVVLIGYLRLPALLEVPSEGVGDEGSAMAFRFLLRVGPSLTWALPLLGFRPIVIFDSEFLVHLHIK